MEKYIEIYEALKKDIINGLFPVGSKLPSKRNTKESYNVSTITVEHAYELLIEESYIEARERSGYYVIYDEQNSYDSEKRVHFDHHIPSPQNKEKNTSPLPFNVYSKAVKRVLTEYGDFVTSKSPNFGMDELKEALSGYLGRSRHMKVEPSQIIIGAGAEYLYRLIVATLGRNTIYAVEKPSYEQITKIYTAEGVNLDFLPMTSDGIESYSLWKSNAKVLHITPYRSYPSRISASASKKREYLRWSYEKDAIIIEDDCESEFSPSRKAEETLFAIESDAHVIYLNTFTRTISPSIRMGYMVIPKDMIKKFNESVGFYSCPVATLEQLVVANLIDNGDFERHLNRMRRIIRG